MLQVPQNLILTNKSKKDLDVIVRYLIFHMKRNLEHLGYIIDRSTENNSFYFTAEAQPADMMFTENTRTLTKVFKN